MEITYPGLSDTGWVNLELLGKGLGRVAKRIDLPNLNTQNATF